MDWEGSDEPLQVVQKEYHCVICGQSSPSKEDKPMGLVVLVQVHNFIQFYRMFRVMKFYPLVVLFFPRLRAY